MASSDAYISIGEDCECTFLCGAVFTTFSEWKQHEIDEHWPVAEIHLFICTEPVRWDLGNGRYFHDKCRESITGYDAYVRHCRRTHDVRSGDFESRSLCASHGFAFWCGFCNAVIPFVARPVNRVTWWDRRALHIESHFNIEGRTVRDGGWKQPEDKIQIRLQFILDNAFDGAFTDPPPYAPPSPAPPEA